MKYLVLAALLSAQPVCAGPVSAGDALYALYAGGHYQEAMRAGAAARTAYGYGIAARAALADAVLRDAPCLACIQRGEDFAHRAVAADPTLADGQIWLAVSLGYESRISGILSARLHGRPAQAKTALDAAVKDDPKNPYAVSALGGWNVEVVRGGGAYLARKLYGANIDQAVALFDRAAKLAPDNVAVRYQIALSLAGLNPVAWRGRIASELDAAIRAGADTAYEHAMQARARDLRAALDGDRFQFDAKVRKFQGYP
jgi:tetratricopeptide (TPR) repeat protein